MFTRGWGIYERGEREKRGENAKKKEKEGHLSQREDVKSVLLHNSSQHFLTKGDRQRTGPGPSYQVDFQTKYD